MLQGYGSVAELSVADLRRQREDLQTLILMLERDRYSPRAQAQLALKREELSWMNRQITVKLLGEMRKDTDLRNLA